MKILVTGGCGFIGSNFIIDQIQNTENEILNLDKLTYAGNLRNLQSVKNHPNNQFIEGDICNLKLVSSLLFDFNPDAIVHFAAESHVDRSIDQPMTFIKTNIIGTATLLNASKDYLESRIHLAKKKSLRFLHVSTDEVYGSLGEEGFFTEETRYDPSSPYSASKASSDHLVQAWHRTYGFPSIITNCSNNYGPFQFPEKLIPLMITNCINEKELPVYGDGKNIRDWLFVKDHCKAIYSVLLNGTIGKTYNIGGNSEIKNIDIVTTITSIFDELNPRANGSSYSELINYVADRPGHDFRYAIDTSKIKKEVGWSPIETFETGIRKTINWYLENESWWKNIQGKTFEN